MKKKRKILIVLALMTVLLVGCKPSEEKLSEAENKRTELFNAREAAEEKYLDIADTSLRPELDALGVRAAEVGEVDFTKMSNKKIDAYLPEIDTLLNDYSVVQQKLDGTYKEESDINEENAKNQQIDAYVINKTGFNLNSIVLHDLTKDTRTDNLIGEGTVLNDGYTLMGVALPIRTDSSSWEFIITDEAGTEHTLTCDSLLGSIERGASLTFNFDQETGSGNVELGGYTAD